MEQQTRYYPTNFKQVGRLAREPELKITNTGKKLSRNALAYNGYMKTGRVDREGNNSSFLEFVCWEKVAEVLINLPKGRLVEVEGTLHEKVWEKDGKKISDLELTVSKITPLMAKEKASDEAAQTAGA